MIRGLCRMSLILAGLIGTAVCCSAADKAAFSISSNEFRQLSAADQKALLIAAFEHRLEHAKNIYYEVQVRFGNYEFRNGQVGKKLIDANGSNYRHWQLRNAYRMDTERGGPEVAKPNQFESSGFDFDAGVGKSTVRFSGNDKTYGRIDATSDPITLSNRYAYWLDGKHVPMGEYLIRYLVDHKDSYSIEAPNDQNIVRLTVPWQTIYSKEPWGVREFILDPLKGFLPIRGKARWETDKLAVGKTSWRAEEFIVEASQLVGDVWMPMKLKELINGSPLSADKITVWETKVMKIECGIVKEKNLEISFTPGMKVVDALKGETYIVGPNGEPTNVERVVGARPELAAPKAPPRKKNMVSIWIGTGLLIVVAILIAWRLLQRKRIKLEG